MKKILLNILLTVATLSASCQNHKDIVISGQVVDEISGKPIPNAEIVIFCWYKSFNDASYKKQALRANNEGRYQTKFDKGYQVNIASKAKGYLPKRNYNQIESNQIEINLKLSKKANNPTLVYSNLNTHDDLLLRVHIPAIKDRDELDFKHATTFGFNFKSLTTISDTTQADVWFRIENKEGQPTTLVTSASGGIIPIFENEVESSLLYEKNIAPTTGYSTTYKLTDEELGFFIRCRDGKTYGKLILGGSKIDISSPDGKGSYYKEFGRSFIYLYQPNGITDLSYPQEDIDLEYFLLGLFR